MNPNELRLLFELAQNKGCKFTTLTYRSASSGELARHTLLFGVDYKHALERDLKYLKRLLRVIGSRKMKTSKPDDLLLFTACEELIASAEKSLAKYDNDKLTKEAAEKDVYNHIVPGVKQHKNTGEYYIWAFRQSKEVLQSGKPSKPVNSKPLTIAKDKIRSKLRTESYANFKLSNITKAAVNGNTLILE